MIVCRPLLLTALSFKSVRVSFFVAFQWRDNMPHRCKVALVMTRTGGLHSVIESLCHFGVCGLQLDTGKGGVLIVGLGGVLATVVCFPWCKE